jgi:hypothetical protein
MVMVGMPHVVVVVIDWRRAFRISGGLDAEHAPDAAEDAADRAADHRPDGPGGLVSNINPVRDAVGNALRVGRERASERRHPDCRK